MDTVMMRTTLFLALVFGFCVSTTDAAPLSLASSSPVVFIDGAGDLDAMVSVVVGDTSSGFDFGHVLYDGAFVTILPDSASMTIFSAAGGDIFDFAIRDSSIGVVAAKLSDGSASMYFSGDVAAVSSAHPNVAYDYWQNLTITWTFGNNDFVFNFGGLDDGFAPASMVSSTPVPEPSSMFLLGGGLLGLLGLRRRRNGR